MQNHLLVNRENALLTSPMNSRIGKAETTRDAALNARIERMEQKIQSILQENLRIEAQLNQARALYGQKQHDHEQSKLPLENEIVLLRGQELQLNIAHGTLSQTNLDLANQVAPTIALRDQWRVIDRQIMRDLGLI